MSRETYLRRAASHHTHRSARIVQRMYTPCHREPEAAWQPHGFRELLVANGRCAKGSLSARESRCGLSTHQRASACAAKPPAKKVHCRCNPRLGQLASHCLAQGAWCMAPAGPGGGGGGGVAGCAAALCAADLPTAAPHALPCCLAAQIRTGPHTDVPNGDWRRCCILEATQWRRCQWDAADNVGHCMALVSR